MSNLRQWDTAGQERFRTLTSSYYRGAHGIIIVYDVTNKESFDNVRQWMQEIEKFAADSVIKLLVGNKCDLEEKREVAFDEGQELAKQFNVPFLEVSAKNSTNIEETFTKMAGDIQKSFQSKKKEKKELDRKGGSTLLKPSSEDPAIGDKDFAAQKKGACCQ